MPFRTVSLKNNDSVIYFLCVTFCLATVAYSSLRTISQNQSAALLSPGRLGELRCFFKLCFVKSFAGRSVEQYGVSIRFPNGGVLNAAWSVYAEVDATRFLSTNQDMLRHQKNAWLQLIAFAQLRIDVLA